MAPKKTLKPVLKQGHPVGTKFKTPFQACLDLFGKKTPSPPELWTHFEPFQEFQPEDLARLTLRVRGSHAIDLRKAFFVVGHLNVAWCSWRSVCFFQLAQYRFF